MAASSSRDAWAPKPEQIRAAHPSVLAITGPQQYESVMAAVHQAAPPKHDAFLDLVPPQGIKLTPRHYAYLKISEGCNNRCTFCIIPKLRGDLVSRPIGEVMREAEKLVAAGVKETPRRQPGHLGLWHRREVRRERVARPHLAHQVPRPCPGAGRARRVGANAVRLPLPACRRGHPADGRGKDPPLPRHSRSSTPIPTC